MASLLTILALFTQYRQIKQDTFLCMKVYAACKEYAWDYSHLSGCAHWSKTLPIFSLTGSVASVKSLTTLWKHTQKVEPIII